MLVDPMIRVAPGTFAREYVDDLAELLGTPPGEARDAAVRAQFAQAHESDREGKVHAMRALRLDTLRRLGSDNRADEGGWDLRDALATMKRDTTILRAGEESVVADDDLARLSPSVRVENFAGHGHTLHRSAFERFAEIVRAAAP